MIKVKYERELFMYLMENYRTLVDDLYNGYIYLTCDENMFKRILQYKRYYYN